MTARHLLAGTASPSPQPPPSSTTPPPRMQTLNNDFVVILAALLCALICVLGLVAVSRCSWIRRLSDSRNQNSGKANKGLKKKVLNSIPRMTYDMENEKSAKLTECAICITDFAAGEEIRVLPQCGHGFHVGCIDMWLASHSSCPSCRQILVVNRCQKCGGAPAGAGVSCSIQPEPRESHVNGFLP